MISSRARKRTQARAGLGDAQTVGGETTDLRERQGHLRRESGWIAERIVSLGLEHEFISAVAWPAAVSRVAIVLSRF